MKAKIDDLEIKSKFKDIIDFYTGFSDFKKVYHPRTNIVRMSRVIWKATDSHRIWLDGGTISLSC